MNFKTNPQADKTPTLEEYLRVYDPDKTAPYCPEDGTVLRFSTVKLYQGARQTGFTTLPGHVEPADLRSNSFLIDVFLRNKDLESVTVGVIHSRYGSGSWERDMSEGEAVLQSMGGLRGAASEREQFQIISRSDMALPMTDTAMAEEERLLRPPAQDRKRYNVNISLVAESLTAYAIERQPDMPPRTAQRRFWTDAILQGMARLSGASPDPHLMERFDQRLEQARGCSAAEPMPVEEQRKLIRTLGGYIAALEATGDDRRRQVAVVRDLLGDMISHRLWGLAGNGLARTREQAESALLCMTAQTPIRFTRVLLGGDAGPWVGGFASGAVMDAGAVRKTAVYDEAVRRYPEITDWPAICTVYAGRNLPSAQGTAGASAFDLEIMNQAGDSFLKEEGVHLLGRAELRVAAYDSIRVLKVEPGQTPEMVVMPNTLDAFQAAVGGDIEAVGLDANAVLVCNETGKLMGLLANRQVGGDTIAGTFLIVGVEDGDFCSLSDGDAAHYAEKFAEPMPAQEGPTTWKFYVF